MKSIFFRAFEDGDYLIINKWRNDPQLQALTGGVFRYVSSEMEREWVHRKMLDNTQDHYLAICLNDECNCICRRIRHKIKTADRHHAQGAGACAGETDAGTCTFEIESIGFHRSGY